MSLNKVMLIGHLGADPEIRHSQSGDPIANFSLATSERWRDKNSGERRERTEWHRIVVFNQGLCKVIEDYVRKGSKIYVEGAIKTRKWQDQAGQDRYSTEIVLSNFDSKLVMLDGKGGQRADGPEDYGSESTRSAPQGVNDMDDKIPF